MNTLSGIALTLVMAVVIGYAQFNLERYTAGRRAALLTRSILIITGCALGYLAAIQYPDDPLLALLAFIIGFGTVHFPAAFILLIKRCRGSGKS